MFCQAKNKKNFFKKTIDISTLKCYNRIGALKEILYIIFFLTLIISYFWIFVKFLFLKTDLTNFKKCAIIKMRKYNINIFIKKDLIFLLTKLILYIII